MGYLLCRTAVAQTISLGISYLRLKTTGKVEVSWPSLARGSTSWEKFHPVVRGIGEVDYKGWGRHLQERNVAIIRRNEEYVEGIGIVRAKYGWQLESEADRDPYSPHKNGGALRLGLTWAVRMVASSWELAFAILAAFEKQEHQWRKFRVRGWFY